MIRSHKANNYDSIPTLSVIAENDDHILYFSTRSSAAKYFKVSIGSIKRYINDHIPKDGYFLRNTSKKLIGMEFSDQYKAWFKSKK